LILAAALAHAGATVSEVGPGHVDWTRHVLVVEARAVAAAGSRMDRGALELEARRSLAAALPEAAARVRLEGDRTLGELMSGEHGRALEEGLVRWRVTEARYGQSGSVELTGELDLSVWLRPLAVARAGGTDDAPIRASNTTGLVIDARQVAAAPTYAPRLLAPDGQVLFELGSLSPLAAARRPPVAWVDDPAEALVFEVAGEAPVVMLATDEQDGDLVLDSSDAARLRALASQSDLLAQGRVVVVAQ